MLFQRRNAEPDVLDLHRLCKEDAIDEVDAALNEYRWHGELSHAAFP